MKKEGDHSRLMLLLGLFILTYIFFAGSGFGTGQVPREVYKQQANYILSNPLSEAHSISDIRARQQFGVTSDIVSVQPTQSGDDTQYISYGPFCGCEAIAYEDQNGMWVGYPLNKDKTTCYRTTDDYGTQYCGGECAYGKDGSVKRKCYSAGPASAGHVLV